jgi:hypothetical protein
MTLAIADYRTRVRLELRDIGAIAWDDNQIDNALRNVLSEYAQARPVEAVGLVTLAAAGREFSISTLTGFVRVTRVWLPYTAASPEDPPEWRYNFEVLPGSLLRINDGDEPAAANVARIWYEVTPTINGLDSAASTTVPERHADILTIGAAGHAAASRARELAESATPDKDTEQRVSAFGYNKINFFRARLNQLRNQPAGQYVTWTPARRGRAPRE